MKNRLISILLSIALLIVCLPQLALPASAAETSGKCGDNLTWSFDDSTGTLTISGSGDMDDYVRSNDYDNPAPWSDYQDSIKAVSLPDGLTRIGDNAFYSCSHLSDITIPASVKAIGKEAFYYCLNLPALVIPDSVTDVGEGAFSSCQYLSEVTVGNGVRSIGDQAFEGCMNLKTVCLGSSVERIGSGAFVMCKSLTDITIPESVTSIGDDAFGSCSSLSGVTVLNPSCEIAATDAESPSTLGSADTALIFGAPGSTAKAYAEKYGYLFQALVDGPCARGHAFGGWTESKKPTCTQEGEKYRTCSRCGVVDSRREAQLDHDWEIVAATPGTRTLKCSHCGVTETSSIGKDIHLENDSATEEDFGTAYFRMTPEKSGIYGFYIFGSTDPDWNNTILVYNQKDSLILGTQSLGQSEDRSISQTWLNAGEEYVIEVYSGPVADFHGVEWSLTVQFVTATPRFADVSPKAFYGDSVGWAVAKGVTNGVDKTHFGPDRGCTRGQVVTFLWRNAGSPEPKGTKNPFADVKKGAFYYKAVLWAVENQITNGTGKTTFSPDAICTRAQIVTFLWRADGSSRAVTVKNPFADVSKSSFYYPAMLWAVENGITTGTGKAAFSPDATCTRGQVVTFLWRGIQDTISEYLFPSDYRIVVSRLPWADAQAQAQDYYGGKLVTFESPGEYRYVLRLIEQEGLTDNTYYCLGARREPDGSDYYWTDAEGHLIGEPLNAPGAWCADCWQDGEPNLRWNGREETVVMMFYDKAEARWCWYDASPTARTASRNYAYIIEYR